MESTNAQEPKSITVYWQDNQLAATHYSPLEITEKREDIIASLHLDSLNDEIKAKGLYLEPFTWHDVPRQRKPVKDHDPDHDSYEQEESRGSSRLNDSAAPGKSSLESPIGKYLFPDPSGTGTIVVSFFHIRSTSGSPSGAARTTANTDSTTDVVQLLNKIRTTLPIDGARLIGAMPNWLNANTNGPDHVTNGCPVSPPFPVNDTCESGSWHFNLPTKLPEFLQDASGAGVAVFVLDTVPPPKQIIRAVAKCGDSNALLLDVAENVTMHYQVLGDSLDDPQAIQIITGNDIDGERAGFPMNDHGVFIAGIIRDLAPGAQVECIRVLNDIGVGDTAMLVDALSHIQNRLLPFSLKTGEPGDLIGTPVVVNMSLTATPGEEELASLGYTDQSVAPARLALLLPMLALAGQGVVFTASSGNGSGPRDTYTNPTGKRMRPRFPAAFAYPMSGDESLPSLQAMIPVGALNRAGTAASYSNYPGLWGIGTYGGELPQPSTVAPNAITGTQAQPPIDALRGVYTSKLYPALSKDDLLPMHSPPPISYPEYQPSPQASWAYWSGTSFATPIISALVARILENQPSNGDSVRKLLLAAAPDKVDWTNLFTGESDAWGPSIMVTQGCQPS